MHSIWGNSEPKRKKNTQKHLVKIYVNKDRLSCVLYVSKSKLKPSMERKQQMLQFNQILNYGSHTHTHTNSFVFKCIYCIEERKNNIVCMMSRLRERNMIQFENILFIQWEYVLKRLLNDILQLKSEIMMTNAIVLKWQYCAQSHPNPNPKRKMEKEDTHHRPSGDSIVIQLRT